MLIAPMTGLDVDPNEPAARFRVNRFLSVLSLLRFYTDWDPATRADFRDTVRTMVDQADARHWLRLLDTHPETRPGHPGWTQWRDRAAAELRASYDQIRAVPDAPRQDPTPALLKGPQWNG